MQVCNILRILHAVWETYYTENTFNFVRKNERDSTMRQS